MEIREYNLELRFSVYIIWVLRKSFSLHTSVTGNASNDISMFSCMFYLLYFLWFMCECVCDLHKPYSMAVITTKHCCGCSTPLARKTHTKPNGWKPVGIILKLLFVTVCVQI